MNMNKIKDTEQIMPDPDTRPLIYCAIDTPDIDHALALSAAMARAECGIKLGMEFFNAQGPAGIRMVRDSYPDLSLFIDLKYHDIPNTVAGAIKAICRLDPDYINVHATGGVDMMLAAADALAAANCDTSLLAVTILTSMDEAALGKIGMQKGLSDRVAQLAALTKECGLSGVVCSAKEIDLVRKACGDDFVLMVPGIRPAGSATQDQKRIMTPKEAVAQGATHLVIGRPITQAEDPERVALDILQQL